MKNLLFYLFLFSSFTLCAQTTKLIGISTQGGGSVYAFDPGTKEVDTYHEMRVLAGSFPTDPLHYNGRIFGAVSDAIYAVNPDGTGYELLHSFSDGGEGVDPYGGLTEYDGVLYGTTRSGGNFNDGIIYSIDPDGTDFTVLHHFDGTNGDAPHSNLIIDNGILYGLCLRGGPSDDGVLFSIETNGSNYTRLVDFNGTIGSRPQGSLLLSGGRLYGMASEGGANDKGVIFSVEMDGSDFLLIHEFDGTYGDDPNGALIESGDYLFGMTYGGGVNGSGAIFKINKSTLNISLEYSFLNSTAFLKNPYGSLIEKDGFLYGMAYLGGANYSGGIFKYDTLLDVFQTIHDFKSNDKNNGAHPRGSLIEIGSTLYGATFGGNRTSGSILFSIKTDGSEFNKVKDFDNELGHRPESRVLEYNARLYGTAMAGGAYGEGVVYSMNTDGSDYQVIHDFQGSDGSTPEAGLIELDDVLYGCTVSGGSNSQGVVYKINPSNNEFEIIHHFDNTNGAKPEGELLAYNGDLYGITQYGGGNNDGVIYRVTTDGATFEVLFEMDEVANGRGSNSPLTLSQGRFFGLSYYGGTNNFGTLFSINPDGSDFVKHVDFGGSKGEWSRDRLLPYDGHLYGLAYAGGQSGRGVIFRIDDDGTDFEVIKNLSTESIGRPNGDMTLYDGRIYVTTVDGGTDRGVIFSILPDGSDYTLEANLTGLNGIGHGLATVVVREPTNLSFDQPGKSYGDDPFTLVATSDSPATIEFSSSDENIISVEGALATVVNAGEVTLTASQDPEGAYGPGSVSVILQVSEAAITIEAADKAKTYGQEDPDFTYSVTSGELIGDDELSGDLQREPGEDVGVYNITVGSLDAGPNYQVTFLPGEFEIDAKPITITLDDKTKTYGEEDPELTYSLSVDALEFDDAVAGEPSRTAGEDVGDYNISEGTLDVGSNYIPTITPANFNISQRAIEVTADNSSKTYGEEDPSLTYEITSGTLADGDDFSGFISRETGENAGDYDILQNTLSLNSNYNFTFNASTFTIDPLEIDVAASTSSKIYGEADPEFEFVAEDLLNDDTFTGTLSREAGEDVGDYEIVPGSLSAGSNYTLNFTSANFSITHRDISIQADDISKVYGMDDPALTYQITEGTLAEGDALFGELARTVGETVGSYEITQNTLDAGSNYNLSYTPANLTINTRPIAVSADPQRKEYGDEDPTLTYEVSGDLVGSDVFSGALSRQEGEGVGSYQIIQNTLELSNNYELSFEGSNLTIDPRLISVAGVNASKTYGEEDPLLEYMITSGELVGADSFSGEVSRDEGEDVGEYTIRQHTLSLTDNYELDFLDGELSILPRSLSVTASATSKTYGDDDPLFDYESEGLLEGDDISGSLNREPGEDVGSYQITIGSLSATNYSIEYTPSELTIGKATLKASADNQSISVGQPLPALTITYEGFAFDDDESDLEEAPEASIQITNSDEAGEFDITLTGGSDSNYEFDLINGLLTIEEALGLDVDIKMSVFPNPVSNSFKLNDIPEEFQTLFIIDKSGKMVKSFKIEKDRVYNISDIKAGIYLVCFTRERGYVVGQKIIKN